MRAPAPSLLAAVLTLVTSSAHAQIPVAPDAPPSPAAAADPTQPAVDDDDATTPPSTSTASGSSAPPSATSTTTTTDVPAAAEATAPGTLPVKPAPTDAEVEAKKPPAPAPTSTTPATMSATTSATAEQPAVASDASADRRFGDPIPLTRREPTLKAGSFMGGVRYGLVGNGPTRFINDLRFSLTDHIELRTSLGPWPTALMARGRIGSQQGEFGALVLEGGLAWFDAGVRLQQDTGEAQVGARFHFEGSVGWAKALGDRYAVHAYAHYRERVSLLADDGQRAAAVDAHFTGDLLPNLSLSAGLGFATTIGTPVREVVINFVETDRAGISHLLARDEGGTQSVTIPLTLTYGRVDSFDVDLFCTPRVWPEFGILFGAGVRFRLEPLFGSPSTKTAVGDPAAATTTTP